MRVLIIGNRANPKAVDAVFQIIAYLQTLDIEAVVLDVTDIPSSSFVFSGTPVTDISDKLQGDFVMAITLGGDGTILHSARITTMLDIPTFGANFGHLGFLCNEVDEGIIPMLAAALSGDVTVDKRTTLRIDVVCEGDDAAREMGEPIEGARTFFAVNEISIARGAMGHIVDFNVDIAGDFVAHMRGDGVVIATATGSTAYALSAGGPLIAPGYRGLVVVPVAPHTLSSRPIVTESQDIVEVTLTQDDRQEEISLFADGDSLKLDKPVRRVIVRGADVPLQLMKYRKTSFYKQLSQTFFGVKQVN